MSRLVPACRQLRRRPAFMPEGSANSRRSVIRPPTPHQEDGYRAAPEKGSSARPPLEAPKYNLLLSLQRWWLG
jgi:hypothetical protein